MLLLRAGRPRVARHVRHSGGGGTCLRRRGTQPEGHQRAREAGEAGRGVGSSLRGASARAWKMGVHASSDCVAFYHGLNKCRGGMPASISAQVNFQMPYAYVLSAALVHCGGFPCWYKFRADTVRFWFRRRLTSRCPASVATAGCRRGGRPPRRRRQRRRRRRGLRAAPAVGAVAAAGATVMRWKSTTRARQWRRTGTEGKGSWALRAFELLIYRTRTGGIARTVRAVHCRVSPHLPYPHYAAWGPWHAGGLMMVLHCNGWIRAISRAVQVNRPFLWTTYLDMTSHRMPPVGADLRGEVLV